MGWRDFLVFADASEDGMARLAMAQDIATAHDGHLEALVLTPMTLPFGANPSTGSAGYAEAEAAARNEECMRRSPAF